MAERAMTMTEKQAGQIINEKSQINNKMAQMLDAKKITIQHCGDE